MRTNEILEGMIKKYGTTAQLNMVKEECAELIQAICKYERNPCVETIMDIAEETGDVELTLPQLKIIFRRSHMESLVLIEKGKKMMRMEKLLKEKAK